MTRPAALLEFAPPDPPQIWLLVFMDPPDAGRDAPWPNRMLSRALRLLGPGFRHVLALSPLPAGGWLVCNPGSCQLGLGVARDSDVLPHLKRGAGNGRARCVAVAAARPGRVRLRGLFTCVNVVAHLTGIDCPPWTTPRGLYRRAAAMQTRRDDRPAEPPMIAP
jgi:hypothetical protein